MSQELTAEDLLHAKKKQKEVAQAASEKQAFLAGLLAHAGNKQVKELRFELDPEERIVLEFENGHQIVLHSDGQGDSYCASLIIDGMEFMEFDVFRESYL